MELILGSFLLLHYLGVRAEVQLLQPQSVPAQYGGQVRLSCIASGYEFTGYWIAWLKQVPRNQPVYMGYIRPRDGDTYFTESFRGRFNSRTDNNKNMAYLDISDVQLEDAAVYYCARDIWDSDGLIFGTGTRLDVLPSNKPTTPPEEVFELKAKGDVSSIACLAKDFYPKDIEIYVNQTKQENVHTILSKEGLYSAVSVQNGKYEDFTCEVKQPQNLTTVKSKGTDNQAEEETDSRCERTDSSFHRMEEMNMLSLTVMGMRALFAKTLVFNLILSAKIFLM